MLAIEHLDLSIGNRRILNDINFRMKPGTFQLVIGPNGAGKSSLLKCVLSFHAFQRGRIFFEKEELAKMSFRERARRIAYVPQFLDVRFNLDVGAFMELSCFIFDDEPRQAHQRRILDSLELTGTRHLLDAYLEELSGGERQRVLVAAALVQQSKLLILDEPSSALDPSHKVELVDLLRQLHENQGLTILLVTHDWNAFSHLNPNILALKDGGVAFESTLNHLDHYLEDVFDCHFHHMEIKGHLVSIPEFQRPDP